MHRCGILVSLSFLLSSTVAGCGDSGDGGGARASVHPAGMGLIFDGIVDLEKTAEPYRCELSLGVYEDANDRPLRIAFYSDSGTQVAAWDVTWYDAFVIRDSVLYRATLQFPWGPARSGNVLAALDLRRNGAELWSTRIPVPAGALAEGRVRGATVRFEFDSAGGLLLVVQGDDGPAVPYAVERTTGALSEPSLLSDS